MDDKLLEKIQKLIKGELRPLKDFVEMTKVQVDSLKLFASTTSRDVRTIKEQQSLMNDKLDQHTGSLVDIENTNKIYGDMYKQNNDNMKKLEKRIKVLEGKSNIIPPPEFTLTDFQ